MNLFQVPELFRLVTDMLNYMVGDNDIKIRVIKRKFYTMDVDVFIVAMNSTVILYVHCSNFACYRWVCCEVMRYAT